jgi:hypothetical protein
MKLARFKLATIPIILATFIVILSYTASFQSASAASSNQFAAANNAIQNAYALVYHSEVQDHADVTNLINQLNNATQFVNKAYAENSTNPTQATNDLLSAENIALRVGNQTAAASSTGIRVHQLQTVESIGVAITVVATAGLIYAFSDSIYRKWWIRNYGTYIVRIQKNKNAAK